MGLDVGPEIEEVTEGERTVAGELPGLGAREGP